MADQRTLLILGHSFVRRLRDYLAHSCHNGIPFGINLGVSDDFGAVIFHGVGGMTVAGLYEEVDLVRTLEPSAVIMDVGTNNLARGGCDPIELGTSLVRAAQTLLRIDSVREVILCQLLPRVELRTTRRARCDFNTARVIVNDKIRSLCADLGHIHFWPHRGMHRNWQAYFDRQGLHLNAAGQRKYARSIRGAALFAARCCRLS